MKNGWMWATLAGVLVLGLVVYGNARNWNPTRPLIGEPTGKHFEFFARRFNNAMYDHGHPLARYSTDLRRTDSITNPIVGTFSALTADGDSLLIGFAWQDGRWVSLTKQYQEPADEAQR